MNEWSIHSVCSDENRIGKLDFKFIKPLRSHHLLSCFPSKASQNTHTPTCLTAAGVERHLTPPYASFQWMKTCYIIKMRTNVFTPTAVKLAWCHWGNLSLSLPFQCDWLAVVLTCICSAVWKTWSCAECVQVGRYSDRQEDRPVISIQAKWSGWMEASQAHTGLVQCLLNFGSWSQIST